MLIHYNDHNDNEILAEITTETYRELLLNNTGQELAVKMRDSITIIERDPRQSQLNKAKVFFSFHDVANCFCSPSELLSELDAIE